MKKVLFILLGAGLLLGSCGSYEAAGAYTGSTFGNMLGSAIGGIAGGWRGHEIGSLIGTVGGGAVGAIIGSAADRSQEERIRESRSRAEAQRRTAPSTDYSYDQRGYEQSGYDPQMRGDDRIDFSGSEGVYPSGDATYSGTAGRLASGRVLEIRHAGVFEDVKDGVLSRGETCKVVFEIANISDEPVFDVFPLVDETTGNKHVHISPNLRVESIAPHKAIRYTATLKADNGLRDGQIEVRVGVAQGNNVIKDQTRCYTVPTAKLAR